MRPPEPAARHVPFEPGAATYVARHGTGVALENDLLKLDAAFPPPSRPVPLEVL